MKKEATKKAKPVVLRIGTSGKEIQVHCAHTELVPIEEIVGNPRNPNTHPLYQIDALAKIITAQGWRAPITISKRSGFVVRGHGRLKAALKVGFSEVPVDYQDYADEATEWADLVADNRLSELSEIDLDLFKQGLEALDQMDFDMELTGFSNVELDGIINDNMFENANDPDEEWDGMPEYGQEEKRPERTIKVHFIKKDGPDIEAFGKLVGHNITDLTKYVWYPKQELDRVADLRWKSEEENSEV